MINSRTRRQLALSISVVAAITLASCGSDTKEASDTAASSTVAAATIATTVAETTPATEAGDSTPDTTAVAPASAGFDRDAYCSAEVALEMASSSGGDPDADPVAFATVLLPLAQTSQTVAPSELSTNFEIAVGALQTVVDTKDPSGLQELDTLAIHQFDAANCPWTGENVTTEDYRFVNLPDTLVAGDYDFEVTNQAAEPHVLVIVEKKDGVTATWDELLASPEAESMVQTVAAGFAPPGGSGYTVTHLDAGEYLALCPIPQGTTGGAEGTGPPHFTLGMHQVITVKAG